MTPAVRGRFASVFVAAVLASALAGTSMMGQAPSQPAATATDPQARLAWFDRHLAMKDGSPFKGLSWQFLGPTNISGRCPARFSSAAAATTAAADGTAANASHRPAAAAGRWRGMADRSDPALWRASRPGARILQGCF